MIERVTTDLDLALILCPEGIHVGLHWLDNHDIGFGIDRRYTVFLTDAYEAWKALDLRKPSERDVVVQAFYDMDEFEETEFRDLVRYLRVRGWWVI